MTITALSAPPTPPNANADRAMFVWINGAAGNASDPIKNDANIQSLLTFCGNNGVNLVYLDVYPYIGGGNWSPAQLARAVRYLKASGIRVYALCGNTDWAHNQQWVATNILRKIANYQTIQDGLTISGLSGTGGAAFDGLIFDVEYWTVPAYTSVEPIGLCDLMLAAKQYLDIPVGCFATQWLADGTSAALTITYNGLTQLEGLHLMDHADFVAVACYFNNATAQINTFTNWFNYASVTAANRNLGLFCGSETQSGLGTSSYWTGSPGAKAAMETAHTAVSAAFTASPNTNMSFRGQCIDPYSPASPTQGYAQMT